MSYKMVTIVQAICATVAVIAIASLLKGIGLVEDPTKIVAGLALYLAWLARIRQDP